LTPTLTPTPTTTPTPTLTPTPAAGVKVYVALLRENFLSIVDFNTRTEESRIDIGTTGAAHVTANETRQEVYISMLNGNTFYILDARTRTLRPSITHEVGPNSWGQVVHPTGNRVYLATSGGTPEENKILFIDPAAPVVERIARLGPYTPNLGISGIVISTDGTRLFALDRTAGQIVIVDAGNSNILNRTATNATRLLGVDPDGTALYLLLPGNTLQKVTIQDYAEIWQIAVSGNVERVVFSPDGRAVYIPDLEGNQLVAVDRVDGRLLTTISIPQPLTLDVSPDQRHLFVSSQNNQVVIVELATNNVVDRVPVSGTATGITALLRR
jgi:DNA-binding beta-propeller fold protein YncE